jgi:uroporphyrinogen-III synthase
VAVLGGRTIAVTEARRATELATLIRKLGGIPYSAPAVREVPREDLGAALAVLEQICRGEVHAIIFLTGVGARTFLTLAAEQSHDDALRTAMRTMLVVARGPKPVAVLREAGLRIDVVPAEPTSEGVLAALSSHPLAGRTVAVQLYGEDNPPLLDALAARGATVREIPLYQWATPEDEEPLSRLVRDCVAGRVDVLAFTSSPQVTNVFAVAERLGLTGEFRRVLSQRVPVAAIGPVCASALRERGVLASIRPDKGTMGALVHAIAEHIAANGTPDGRRGEA